MGGFHTSSGLPIISNTWQHGGNIDAMIYMGRGNAIPIRNRIEIAVNCIY
jgi:hypothetical protein